LILQEAERIVSLVKLVNSSVLNPSLSCNKQSVNVLVYTCQLGLAVTLGVDIVGWVPVTSCEEISSLLIEHVMRTLLQY